VRVGEGYPNVETFDSTIVAEFGGGDVHWVDASVTSAAAARLSGK
jgi:hypothetical protein